MSVLNKKQKHLFILFLVSFFTVLISLQSIAQAAQSSNPCQIQNTLPAGMNQLMSEFGDIRPGPRYHKGTDFYYNSEVLWPVPEGCVYQRNSSGNLVWEQSSKKANGDPNGWGWYTVLDCGTQGGETIKIRVAHLPKQPFGPNGAMRQGCSGNAAGPNNRTGEMAHGCSRSGAHYHVETFIGSQAVDTQCIFGMLKGRGHRGQNAGCQTCPIGATNLCDANSRRALKQHGQTCIRSTGVAPAGSTDDGIDPSSIQGTGPTPDPTDNTNFPEGPDYDHPEDDTATGGIGYTPPGVIIDDGDTPPPIVPTPPDVPGNPGSNPNLVPEPNEPAAKSELSGCATDTWTAMVNESVLQTRRQDVVNKRYIIKPDSVLDYTCFSGLVKTIAEKAGPIFSETENWGIPGTPRDVEILDIITNKKVSLARNLGSKSLDNALMDVVESSMINYKNGQFNNAFLAGSAPVPNNAGQSYCNVMAQVWKAAKCKNFGGIDTFYTFEDLTTKDPREFPENMRCDR